MSIVISVLHVSFTDHFPMKPSIPNFQKGLRSDLRFAATCSNPQVSGPGMGRDKTRCKMHTSEPAQALGSSFWRQDFGWENPRIFSMNLVVWIHERTWDSKWKSIEHQLNINEHQRESSNNCPLNHVSSAGKCTLWKISCFFISTSGRFKTTVQTRGVVD